MFAPLRSTGTRRYRSSAHVAGVRFQMNWEAIGAVGEIIGAMAVFCTLLYLAIQIKQVKSDLHISSLRDTNQMGNELLASLSQSTDLVKVVSKASDDVTTLEPWEMLMLDSFFMRGLNSWELTLEQLETGALNAPKDSVYEVFGRTLDQPWVADVWNRTRINYPKRFQKLVDRQLEANKSVGT